MAAKTTTPSPPARTYSVGGRLVNHGAKRARSARDGIQTLILRRFEATAADLARCRCRAASANGVGRSAPRAPAHTLTVRQPRQVRQRARALWAVGRISTGRSARGPHGGGRTARDSKYIATNIRSRSRRPGAVSVKRSFGQRRGMEGAPRWPRRQPRQGVRQHARALWAVRWLTTGRSARGPRATEFKRSFYGVSKLQPPTWRGVVAEEPRLTAWVGARPPLRPTRWPLDNHAKFASVHVLCGQSALSPQAKRAGAARRGPHGAGFEIYSHEHPKPQPPTMLGVGEEKPRPTVWGGARPALAAKATSPSPLARVCSVG